MDFTLSDDHRTLRDSAAAFLDREVDLTPLLKPGATVAAADYDGLWRKIADLGWPSLIVPEAQGGLGMSCLDLAMIVGEMGRTLAPAPLFGTLAGSWALLKAGSAAQQEALLGKVVAGDLKLAVAVADRDNRIGAGVTVPAPTKK